MNEIQRNFKNQMYEAEVKLHEKAERENKGIFTNKLFELRFIFDFIKILK